MVATSATRDAANRGDFTEMVNSTLGQDPEVISGDEEAELSFAGAVGELDPATGPFLVVDIGGGSTELVIGTGATAQRTGSAARSAWTSGASGSPNASCGRIRRRRPSGTRPVGGPGRCCSVGWTGCRWSRSAGWCRCPGTATTVAAAALKLTDLRPGPDPPVPDPGRPGAPGGRIPDAAPTGLTGRRWGTCTRAGSTSSAAAR